MNTHSWPCASGSSRLAPILTLPHTGSGTAAAPDPVPPQLGPYQVIAHLARGGMGGVYMARHMFTGRRVALKVLDARWAAHADLVRRLHAELDVAQQVCHDGLVDIFECGCDRGMPYLVMELVDGENLGTLVERGRMELGAVAAIGAQIADAIDAMHAAGIVHCDLKPENVMVLYEHGLAGWPRVKVLDFGVVRSLDSTCREVAGTPPYMAPEQWRGDVVRQTDIYALGCLLYELVTGAPPFVGSIPDMVSAHADQLPAPMASVRAVPLELERLVARMLSKDPGMRPRSMADVARRLADLAYTLPPGARAEVEPAMAAQL